MSRIERILFIELLGGIGDLVMALPAIHALGRSHPSATLTVLTFAPGHELLQFDPLVHRVICAQRDRARASVDALLASASFDLIVSDTNYDGIAEAIRSSGATQVVDNLWRSPPPNQLVSDRFVQLLQADGVIAADAIEPDAVQIHLRATERAIAHQALGAAYRPLVFLCADAGMPIKRWSVSRFIELGQALQRRYQATIVVTAGAEAQSAADMVKAIGGSARLWPRGSLRLLTAALAEADLVVAADTGIARIAAALTVPTITLFGPAWHGRYGQPAPHINLQGFPECPERNISNFTDQPCWYSGHCPFEWDTCLEAISPNDVLGAAAHLLATPHPSSPPPQQVSFAPCHTAPGLPAWDAVRNLLVLRLDNIGDVLMTSPTLRSLKANLPSAKLTLMASPSGSLAAPLLPWVDDVLIWRTLWQDLGRLSFDPDREWNLIETLRQRQFDAAVILTSFSQSPHPPALACALAGIPLRLGESKERDSGTLTHAVSPAPDDIHQVDRNLRLIEAVGFPVSDRRLCLHIPPLRLPIPKPYLLLNPWTSCQSRNYEPDRFAVAARQLSQLTGWAVVVTGVETDRDRAQSLLTILGEGAIDLIGKTSLSELVALIASASLVLSNNTSTMHIADATQTPNVILFAGTEQECQWQPRHSPSRLLRRSTVCSPCYAFNCPYEQQCLDISPEAVVAAALDLLTADASQSVAQTA
ncbi:glycosyltransferase family 9 protein [Oculatella sp. LEGE 06141]|uniref:glycosyltransferase family 9 protein n=1 Tax=Oculatella sp. LEGE 06141 TaxID=1828648 RepID=UPI00187E63DE|nr:glycosyltransferase family 9 protein [Oculatella sp. LEGE 06141]MBE9180439.1 glycosyltransferase family 9 protein [Oculatella sp. LEGE 06141]